MKLNNRTTRLLQILIAITVFSGLTIPLALWLSRLKVGSSLNHGFSRANANTFSIDYSRTPDVQAKGAKSSAPWQQQTGQLGNDILYYIMVDRFADADPSNNKPFIPDSIPPNPQRRHMEQHLSDASYDPGHRLFGLFYGGDLQGVRRRLPYLKSLGVTKIVLSPIQEGPPGFINNHAFNLYLDTGDGSHDLTGRSTLMANYHGYWLRDWFRIDPHYRRSGSTADDFYDFRQLLNEARALGMGVLLDLTLHQASNHWLLPSDYPDLDTSQSQNIFVSDSEIRRSGKTLATWSSNHNKGANSWYASSCKMNYDRPTAFMLESCILGAGLPTLNHKNATVEQYLLEAAKFWLTINPGGAQVQGFRIDAAKHLNPVFLQKPVKEVRSVNPSAILFAENFGSGSQSRQTFDLIRNVGNISIIDFDFTESARAYFSQDRSWFGHRSNLEIASNGDVVRRLPLGLLPAPLKNLSGMLTPVMPSNTEASKSWITYLGGHDIPALRTFRPGMNDAHYGALVAFLMTARGVPMITWGGEFGLSVPPLPHNNGLNGIGGDPFNRPMMLFPGQQGYNPELAALTRRMVDLRRRYPVLRYGDTIFLRDRDNPIIGRTILMLRRPAVTVRSVDGSSILFAFSPRGGQYTLDLQHALSGARSVESCDVITNRCRRTSDASRFSLQLQPEKFEVMILHPNA